MKKTDNNETMQTRTYMIILMSIWSVLIAASFLWNFYHYSEHSQQEALQMARAMYEKNIIYRRWNAGHGGVYVPVTEKTVPNPYLENIPDRDVTTTKGAQLTLINPAYMTRQVNELMDKTGTGYSGHITSLNPIRPENRPDAWEKKALMEFEKGAKEISSVETMNGGKPYLRYMRPVMTEERCLKCHSAQGYKTGDIRGGISVSIQMTPLYSAFHDQILPLALGHGLIWIFGMTGIFIGGIRQARAQTKLKDNESRLELIMNTVQTGIMTVDAETHVITGVNNNAAEIIGMKKEDIIGKVCHKFICPAEKCKCPITDLGQTLDRSERVVINSSGKKIPIIKSVVPITLNGRKHLLESFLNISDLKETEMKLNETTGILEIAFNNIYTPVAYMDRDFNFIKVNFAYAKADEKEPGFFLGKNHFDLYPNEENEALFKKVAETGIPHYEFAKSFQYAEHPERGVSYWDWSLVPIIESGGKAESLILTLSNVTERFTAEKELEKVNAELLQHNKELEQIAYVMLHDMRSPLVNVQGYGAELQNSADKLRALLLSEGAPEETKEKVLFILDKEMPEELSFISGNILKMDALHSGVVMLLHTAKTALKAERLDMNFLISGIADSLQSQLKESGAELAISVLPDCTADRKMTIQAFTHLIGNAVKYLDPLRPGIIKISGRREDDRSIYCIEDNGIGIAPEYHQDIFEIFHKLDMTVSGQGLGLTIVKKVVERHNGKVWVESEEGRGSKFYVSLPG